MFGEIYLKFLAKDKSLRHAFQHFEVTILVLALLYLVTRKTYTGSDLLIFLGFTYIPDIDGLSSVFFWHKSNHTAEVVYVYLTNLKLKEALAYGTVHHKSLNRLILHNIVAYPLLWILLFGLLTGGNFKVTIAIATLLGHLTFDMLDDVYQLRQINNWLWPIKRVLN